MANSMTCREKDCTNRVEVRYRMRKGKLEIDSFMARCESCGNKFRAKREANRIERARKFRERMDALK